ncbi:MAG TPA: hypothetical protein VHF06_29900 [Pseudonocardiaceae bacterium]|nr:hypothetical protein [Pseudonocardiaceae bacterium]
MSASRIVAGRWAMTKLVRLRPRSASACRISDSVCTSTALVASSST